ncbi:tetratricopeptide repeat protein [Moorena sp. SIO3H5]|uniref:tetratricopeptide repeat protein n=1 Tax=Moorena sp. SIO3H5 TaxID=2607834 RepID=UPI0013BC2333|nr:tetratricopeptide repeat protein [Moorena sp. SIO3H5]NEO72728.1 tetratricopeptide repeat protein [Moorena sp. SIO3H5]
MLSNILNRLLNRLRQFINSHPYLGLITSKLQNLLLLIQWFTLARMSLFVASLALLSGAKSPWYNLPQESLDAFDTNLFVINSVRYLVILFPLIILIALFIDAFHPVARLMLWVGLFAVLLFPYFFTTYSPTVTFLSTSYSQQGNRASSHVEKKFSHVNAQWKQNIVLDASKPLPSIFSFKIPDSRFFQMSSWDTVWLEGFGYKNGFFSSIGKGWSSTITGLVIGLIGLYMGLGTKGIDGLIKDMTRLLPVLGLVLGLIVISLIGVNIINYQIDALFAKGEYNNVVAKSEQLSSWYPPLTGDLSFLIRWGKASFYGKESNPALINFVKGIERYNLGDFAQAERYLQASLQIQPNLFLAKEYLASDLINQGVEYAKYTDGPKKPVKSVPVPYRGNFRDSSQAQARASSQRPTGAAEYFERAIEVFPDHIEALYDLMLVRAINGEFEKSAQAALKIIDAEKYLQLPNVALLGQAYMHLTWADYHGDDIETAWKRYRQTADSGTWEELITDPGSSEELIEEQP